MRKRLTAGCSVFALWMAVCHGSPERATEAEMVTEAARVPVGDSAIDPGVYEPFESRWLEFDVGDDGRRTLKTTSCERMTIRKEGKRRVLEDVQRTVTGEDRGDRYTFRLDLETLAPILVETHDASAGTTARFDFTPTEVRIRCRGESCPPVLRSATGAEVRKTVALEVPVFEFLQASWGTLLAALPLRDGYRAALPIFHPAQGAKWLTFEVHGPEEVACEGGKLAAWKITSPQAKFILHVSQRPPYWIRYEGPGPAGKLQIYERAPADPHACSSAR